VRPSPLLVFLTVVSVFLFGCAGIGAAQDGPRQAPDFKVTLLTGEEVSLTASAGKPLELRVGAVVDGRFQEPHVIKGRPLVLTIGASWCPHCNHEAPVLKRVYDSRKQDAEMLIVITKSPRKDALNMVKKYGFKAMVGFDPDGLVAKAFGVTGIPATFFIDSSGKIVDEYFGSIEEDELNKKIDSLAGR